MASDSDTDSIQTISDEGEGDDSGDLSLMGAAATSVKFQTVQQQSYQVAEGGTERLAQQVLHSCELSNQQLVPTSGDQMHEESRDNATGIAGRVFQQNFIQVQQQFDDVIIRGTRNLTIGGTQNIGKPGQCQDENEKALNKAEIILRKTLSKIEDWTKGMVRISALERILKLTEETNWVTIKGSPGEGKSTVAYMALRELHKMGRQIFQVSSPKEFSQVIATYSQPVIMLDDIFGNLEFNPMKWLLWEDVLHDVIDPKEHRSHDNTSKKSVTVILVAREYVLNAASCNMGRMADFFTQDEHVVFMSNTVERDIQEKHAIWKAISDSSGIELDQNTIDKICRITVPHGFPHVCRLFATIQMKSPKITAEDFFQTPLEFLNQTVLKFMHNKVKIILFKELIKSDGKVSVRELGMLNNGCETIQTAYDLAGTYLRKEDDFFMFDHPSIYDSVAYNICKLYPLFVINNCNLSFIHERVRIEPSRGTQLDTPSKESGLVVYIPRSYVRNLAKRFATEISKLNLLQVFSHKEFRDEPFITEVMPMLQPLTKLVTLTDCKSGENFLSLLASNKSPQLLNYVHNNIDRQLTKDEINTVLYGVCKYAASNILTYLSQICDELDINVKYDDMDQTPFMMAANTRDSQFVQDMLSLNPDVNARDRHGATAFHYLCKNGLVSAVTQMLDSGTNINIEDGKGRSALFYACRSNHVDVVKLLLDREVRFDGMTVEVACKHGSVKTVNLLFQKGATVNMASGYGYSPLHSACFTGNIKVISYLIEKGASVNAQDDKSHWSPLHDACFCNESHAVQYLLDHDADMGSRDIRGNTPLHTAAGRGSKECVDVLLKAGADVNVQSEDGNTPLHTAAARGSKACVDVLLYTGVNVKRPDGNTPLHKAAEGGSKECVDALLKADADVNAQNINGQTSLHTAVYSKPYRSASYINLPDISVCETLIRHRSDINKQDTEGNTPLHLLCRVDNDIKIEKDWLHLQPASSYQDMYRILVTLFIDHGADVNIHNNRRDPALRGWCQTLITRKQIKTKENIKKGPV